MNNIDVIDRKILYQLSINSRQSNNQLAKKTGIKNNIVNYRIKKLEEHNIIRGYHTVTNTYSMFGISTIRFHYSFDLVPSDIEQKINQFICENKNISFAVRTFGAFDLSFLYHYHNIKDIYTFNLQFKKNFGSYIKKETISHYIYEYYRPLEYLLKQPEKHKWITTGIKNIPSLSHQEINILSALAENARIQLYELAQKVGLTSETISKKIRHMIKSGIIIGFRPSIDITKLGYESYKLNISLKNHHNRKAIIQYLEDNPHLIYIDFTFGENDLEFEFHLKNLNELADIIMDINTHFPDSIRHYNYVMREKMLKFSYFPKEPSFEKP